MDDQAVGEFEDFGSAAVVFFQSHDGRIGELSVELENVFHPSPAPAVDRLVVVADDAEVIVVGDQCGDDLVLSGVCVLVLVDHHVIEALLVSCEHVGVIAEQFFGAQQQVIEVDGVGGLECDFVSLVGECCERVLFIERSVSGRLGPQAVSLPVTDPPQQVAGSECGRGAVNVAECLACGAFLVGPVVDGEPIAVAERFDVLSEDADAERVERRDDRLQRLVVGPLGRRRVEDSGEQFLGPLFHFSSRLVGKGDGKDLVGANAVADQVSDPEGDDSRLAGTGTGQDQYRAAGGVHRLDLRSVQSVCHAESVASPWRVENATA